MRVSQRDPTVPTAAFHVHGNVLGIALLQTLVLHLRWDIRMGVEGALVPVNNFDL